MTKPAKLRRDEAGTSSEAGDGSGMGTETTGVSALSASPPWGPRAGTPRDQKPRTLAGQAAERLRQDIIRNRLHPGERLTIEKLMRSYGVGTSPLREALFQVAGDGLVRVEDHKGFIVAPLNFDEMRDVSSLRAYLEMNAIRRSIENGGDDWETSVLTAEHRLTKAETRLEGAVGDELILAEDEWEHRHRDFHYALCSACGSPWLLHFFDALYDQLERYRRHFWRYEERARGAHAQHEQIKEAALARDADRAVELLAEHFREQADLTVTPASPTQSKRNSPR
ncbi:FCD domain-containing protein [Candidimonas humi]|jgi:DNA-binding GntR family transcriptional regulator|uniref:GntR family transcriptional regulator n=1 Tax=Candidimonas humi TaxID=683355 RepID=A0ABV8P2W6_9BURK|nr:FCD domain-containing protein [Candidimonas humi]MBV6306823.1 FCD domain-containing protein [Candidimonas humi]